MGGEAPGRDHGWEHVVQPITNGEAAHGCRPWLEIMAGIDWLGNATWALYAPFSSAPKGGRLELRLLAPAEHPAHVLAQARPSSLAAPCTLCRPPPICCAMLGRQGRLEEASL